MTVRVVVADDQDLVRTGLTMILNAQPDIEVVGEAADGKAAVELAQRLRPDVCLFDIRMPGLSGIEACRQIVEKVEGCRVIMLTSYAEDELLFAAIRAGASGYVLKRIGDNDLVQAVERIKL